MDDRPIGVLDSGFGGLTILRSIQELLPREGIIYFGDNAFAPYGKKEPEIIRQRVAKIISFLIKQNVKLVVVACNTATVVGIDYYRDQFPATPIVGVVPVIKTATELTKTKKIAVLETSMTAQSQYQKRLIEKFATGCQIIEIACDQLVEQIEAGEVETAAKTAKDCLGQQDFSDVDVLALSCTHFVFLKDFLKKDNWKVLDSGGAVARQVKRILENNQIMSNNSSMEFFTTGECDKFKRISNLFGVSLGISSANKIVL